MNVLIVEDEAPAARRLRRLVSAELGIESEDIWLADNLDSACRILAEKTVELLLLDLDLSGHDGFEALRGEETNPPATVIVSANIDRALEAFDHDVVDFVSKPVSEQRLARALTRAREARSSEMRLIIRSLSRTEIIPIVTIVRISGADDYVEVATTDGRCLLHYDRLDKLERQLPSMFIRTHRSHIINMTQALRFVTAGQGGPMMIMQNDDEIPISRRRIRTVKNAFSKLASSPG